LKDYAGERMLMDQIDKTFCQNYLDYLQSEYRSRGKRVSNYTLHTYYRVLNGALNAAVRAEIIKSTEGFPEDSNSVDALTTSNVYLEMPYTQYASDIETILNAEHDAIMTMSETVDEGIQNMNDQVPAVLG
jgi:hypothetical protein